MDLRLRIKTLVAGLVLGLLHAIAKLPISIIRGLAGPVGWVIYVLALPRRHVTLTNLGLCFPHWTPAERRRLARQHFQVYVVTLFERFKFWFGPIEQIFELCRVEGIEHINRHQGRPIIILAPHFVGMDAGGLRYTAQFNTAATMYGRQKSTTLNDAMTRGRTRFGGIALLRNDGIRPVIRVLREKIPFFFLPDMDLGARDAVFVPFFGIPAATVTSVSRLARITGAVIIPCVTMVTSAGYETRFYEPWTDYPGDDDEAAAIKMNRFIEQRVLEAPEQYLWSHKRFKTRPEGEPGLY